MSLTSQVSAKLDEATRPLGHLSLRVQRVNGSFHWEESHRRRFPPVQIAANPTDGILGWSGVISGYCLL